jgi:hypothetical protein
MYTYKCTCAYIKMFVHTYFIEIYMHIWKYMKILTFKTYIDIYHLSHISNTPQQKSCIESETIYSPTLLFHYTFSDNFSPMDVYMYVCNEYNVYKCVHIYIDVYIYTRAYTCIYICTYIHTHICISICIYTYMNI